MKISLTFGRKKRYTGRIKVEGTVEVENGPFRGKFRNHFVDSALDALAYILGSSFAASAAGNTYALLYPTTMYIGSDTSTKTAPTTTALAAPIGSAPGTPPNSVATSIGNSVGQSQFVMSASWAAGSVSGTLGEMGLYGYAIGSALTGSQASTGTTAVLLSRLSAADGDFTAFTINTSYPLIINWTVTFTFS